METTCNFDCTLCQVSSTSVPPHFDAPTDRQSPSPTEIKRCGIIQLKQSYYKYVLLFWWLLQIYMFL